MSLGVLFQQARIGLVSPFADMPFSYCLLDSAIGLRGVHAVVKAALAEPGFELNKPCCKFMVFQFPDAVFPHPGGIDQVSAIGNLIQHGRGCGVGAFAGAGGQGAGLNMQVWQ